MNDRKGIEALVHGLKNQGFCVKEGESYRNESTLCVGKTQDGEYLECDEFEDEVTSFLERRGVNVITSRWELIKSQGQLDRSEVSVVEGVNKSTVLFIDDISDDLELSDTLLI